MGPKLLSRDEEAPGFQDVNSDQQNGGLDQLLTYDRVTAARLGQTVSSLDSGPLRRLRPVGSLAHLHRS